MTFILNHALIPPEEFIDFLYQRALNSIKEKEATIISEFGPQDVERWQALPTRGYHPDVWYPSLSLRKGIIAKLEKVFVGLSVGEGINNPYAHGPCLRLQFGAELINKLKTEPSTVEDLARLVERPGWSVFKYQGEFYVDKIAGLSVSCWADAGMYGGEDLRRWGRSRILTQNGVNASVALIQRVVEKCSSDPRSPLNLTPPG